MSQRADYHESFQGHQPAGSSDRSFGLVIAVFLAALACWPLIRGAPLRVWALVAAACFALPALIRPALLRPLNRAWTRLGLLLGRFLNPLIMGALFVFVVTPYALVCRLWRRDGLRMRWDREAGSYWIDRTPPGPEPESMANQF